MLYRPRAYPAPKKSGLSSAVLEASLSFVLCIASLVLAAPAGAQPSFYVNQLGDSIFVADPFVLLHEGTYYLYGTSAADGFKAWKSKNLVAWTSIGYVFQKEEES